MPAVWILPRQAGWSNPSFPVETCHAPENTIWATRSTVDSYGSSFGNAGGLSGNHFTTKLGAPPDYAIALWQPCLLALFSLFGRRGQACAATRSRSARSSSPSSASHVAAFTIPAPTAFIALPVPVLAVAIYLPFIDPSMAGASPLRTGMSSGSWIRQCGSRVRFLSQPSSIASAPAGNRPPTPLVRSSAT